MILYNYYRSSASYRVRIALHLKSLAFEYRPVHLLKAEHTAEAYSELNPSREVPTLVHEGRTLAQSMAILIYLDSVKVTPALFPADDYRKALVVQACEIINAGTQPLGNLKVLNELTRSFGADADQKSAWIRHWVLGGLTAFESLVTKHAGRFCFGDEVSAADCFLVPQLFAAERFNVPVDKFRKLLEIREACESLEAFRRSHPQNQVDTPSS